MSEPPRPAKRDRTETLQILNGAFREMIPHNAALGLEVIDFDTTGITMRLPYDVRWVGNPESGVLHGGVITTLLDASSGASVYMRIGSPVPIATLDLRIDYLKPAAPGRDVFARAECYKLTRNVAFVRAFAFHDDANDPIASAASAFMLHTKGRIYRATT